MPRIDLPIDPALADDPDKATAREVRRRVLMLQRIKASPDYAGIVLQRCQQDVAFWCNQFVYAFEPRLVRYVPFVLWPKQVEYMHFMHERVQMRQEWLTEKSRDVGITYMHVVYALWRWLYTPGFKTTFGSNLERNVDRLGNPDTILEKARIALRRLPRWMRPPGFHFGTHDGLMMIRNPVNGNVIAGEAGPQMGRSGRSTLFFLDEAAFIERDAQVNRATSANAGVRNWASTANGAGNLFYAMRSAGQVPIFRFHWRDDPRKNDEWAAKKKREIGAVAWASEYDIDYASSVQGVIIEQRWIEAARRLERVCRQKRGHDLPVGGHKVAGLDVGAGKDESVMVCRTGALCHPPSVWEETDSLELARLAIDQAHLLGIRRINFDAIGVGHGLVSGFKHSSQPDRLAIVHACPVIVGEAASNEVVWPDGLTSRQKFVNLRADLWWRARECLIRTWEMVLWLETDGAEGIEHEWSTLCALPDDPVLADQLGWLRWKRHHDRRVIVQSKDDLPKSPDRADAFVLSFDDTGIEDWRPEDFAMATPSLELQW